MLVGVVKWFNLKKGFGFLIDEVTREDIFVHFTVIEGDGYRRLWQDEKVEYEMAHGPKGFLATKVRRLAIDPSHNGHPPQNDGSP